MSVTLLDAPLRTVLPPTARPVTRIIGGLRICLGLLLVASILTQVVDNVLHDSFVPTEYFSYFTIQSSLINASVLLVAGVVLWRRGRESELLSSARMATVAYAVVTGVVYAALLRGIPAEGYPGIAWPNEILHVWAPILIALDWLLAPGRGRVGWARLGIALLYPSAWIVFTFIRGAIDGWYPYPFLDPNGPEGWAGVGVYIVLIAGFIILVAAAAIGAARLRERIRR